MRALHFIAALFIFLAWPGPVSGSGNGAGGIGSSVDPGIQSPYPDLLVDSEDGLVGPDLLGDDPIIDERVRYLGDPIFEDDFVFNEMVDISDPLESLNRAIFVFNDKAYFWVLKPTKNAYAAVIPKDIRGCFGNAFVNIAAPIRFINNLLQGELEDAGAVLSRFVINSTLGVFGLGDPAARDFNIAPREADFGQTLGKWGIGDGIYIMLPFLGPSNVRDSVGFVGDIYMHPVPYISESVTFDLAYLGVSRINLLSISPEVYDELKRISLDPYVAARQAYYDYRRSIIDQ
jgi:phospholipid-binding lipoprotein MlaA